MERLLFCDYHNMVAILEKGEHNTDFHPMVDFLEASPLRVVPLFDDMLVPQGEGLRTPTEPYHTPSPEAQTPSHTIQPTSTLPPVSTTSIPTVTQTKTTPIRQYTRRARIAQSSALLPGRSMDMDEGEAATERISDDTEEMETVLTSIDAATVLVGGIDDVPIGSGSIPTAGPPAADNPIGSDVVPTASPVFATTTVVTPYSRRKGKEVMVECDTPKKQRLQEQIDAQVTKELNNETIGKYLQEYQQFAAELPLKRRIELISDLVKYQEIYAKIYKFQNQQRKIWTKKQKRDYYMVVIRNNLGWKVKDFKGMTFEEEEAKFNSVYKQMEDFIPMGSKEEAERYKRKGIRSDQESSKKLKSSEEVIKEAKSTAKIPEEKIKEMMQLTPIEEVYVEALQFKHPIIDWKVHTEGQRSYWKIIRLGGSSACYQFFVDLLKHLDRDDLNQLWDLVKEYLSIRPASSDKEMELWVELKRLDCQRQRDLHASREGQSSEEGSSPCNDLLQASSGELFTDGK
nr:hypothetical protein [Tanacetum cinerariifolium]